MQADIQNVLKYRLGGAGLVKIRSGSYILLLPSKHPASTCSSAQRVEEASYARIKSSTSTLMWLTGLYGDMVSDDNSDFELGLNS
jgi:hypothetical protein